MIQWMGIWKRFSLIESADINITPQSQPYLTCEIRIDVRSYYWGRFILGDPGAVSRDDTIFDDAVDTDLALIKEGLYSHRFQAIQ